MLMSLLRCQPGPEPTQILFPHLSPPCRGVLCCRHGAGGCTDCRCGGSRDGRLGEGSGGQRGCRTWPITVPGERIDIKTDEV